jgi:hypothetical protein
MEGLIVGDKTILDLLPGEDSSHLYFLPLYRLGWIISSVKTTGQILRYFKKKKLEREERELKKCKLT